VRIDVPVRKVVDGATGGSHQEYAGNEYYEDLGIRMAVAGEPQCL
jgi:hypothetical protein